MESERDNFRLTAERLRGTDKALLHSTALPHNASRNDVPASSNAPVVSFIYRSRSTTKQHKTQWRLIVAAAIRITDGVTTEQTRPGYTSISYRVNSVLERETRFAYTRP